MLYSTELRCGKRAAGVVRAARGEKNGRSPRSETKCGYEVGRGDGGPLRDPLMRHPSRFAPRSHLHRRHHPGRKDYAFRHLIDVDMHRNALHQAHRGEDRIDVGERLPAELRVCDVDAAREAKAGIRRLPCL